MGNITSTAVGGIVRATVSVTATNDVDHTTQVNTLAVGVQYVIPAAQLSYIRLVLDVAVDSIGYNKFLHDISLMSDVATLRVDKSFQESQAVVDETTYVLFKKGNLEDLHTSEEHSFSIAKALADVVMATDDFHGLANADDDETMWFSKTVTTELLAVLDSAHVTAGKRFTDVVGKSDVQHTAFGKGLAESQHTAETKHFDIAKQLDDVVDAGDEFNAVALTDDGEVMVFGKTLADTWTYDDSINVQAEKYFEDTVDHPTDQLDYIEVGKGIDDPVQTSEDTLVFVTSKALADVLAPVEQVGLGIGYTIQDWANQGEGPNLYDTYAVGYFAESYALEGFPRLDIVKGIFDTVHSTDDFFGVANADDDETMAFGKTLSEVFHYGDQATVTYSKAILDLASTGDSWFFGTGKSLTDQVNKSDLATKFSGKALADSSSISDAATRNSGKTLSDSANTGGYNSFVLQKSISDSVITTDDFLGNANADDDETMLFGKTVSDSFTKSDLTVKTAGKGLADAASTSESGSIVWTDYWDIGYTDTTGGVFVGNSRTF